MMLILALDVMVCMWLVMTALAKGFEEALPSAAFLLLLFPIESQIRISGLFELTTQRVIVLTMCTLYLMFGRATGRTSLRQNLPLLYLLIGVNAWTLLSSMQSIVPWISFKTFLSQCLDFCALYVIYVRSVAKVETVRKIFAALVMGMSVCSVFGLAEIYGGWRVASFFPPLQSRFAELVGQSERGMRVQSTFSHAILFGAALAFVIPMAIYLLTQARTLLHKGLLWVSLMLMFYCAYKTGSRGPWIAVVLSLGLLLALGRGKIRKCVAMFVVVTSLLLVAWPGVLPTIVNLYAETINADSPQGESYQWRYELLRLARRELSRSLGRSLWGYGPESFYYLGATTDVVVNGEEHTVKAESCDSAIVELMMDTGYVGLLLVGLLLCKAAYTSLRSYFSSNEDQYSYHLVLFVDLATFSFLMTNVELFGWGQQSYVFWILVALAMSRPRLSQQLPAFEERLAPWPQSPFCIPGLERTPR